MTILELLLLTFKLLTFIWIIVNAIAIWNKKNWSKTLSIFYYYSFVTLLISLLIHGILIFASVFAPLLSYFQITNTNAFDFLFYLRNDILLAYFFYLLMTPRKIAKWILYTGFSLAIYNIINCIVWKGYLNPGIFAPLSDNIFCFVVPAIYCWILFQEENIVPLRKNPYFWITMGSLMLALTTFFYYLTENYLFQNDEELYQKLSIGRNFLMMIEQSMYIIAFYYAKNTRLLSLSEQNE